MKLKTFSTIDDMMYFFTFSKKGIILEKDIRTQVYYTEINDRKLHDAEVLTTIMQNRRGNCFEIGTATGRGTYKLATNTDGMVYTLNALPTQISGTLITKAPNKEEIGKYLVDNGITNYQQFYGNSMSWEMPDHISDLTLIFVDGCHDAEYVYHDTKKFYPYVKTGGFIVWHDFCPSSRHKSKFHWLDNSMSGVEKFCEEFNVETVYHLKHSWMGFCLKR